MDKFMVRDQERIPGEGMLHNKMDLNTDTGLTEVRKSSLWNFYLYQIPHGILKSLNYESHTYEITNYISERGKAFFVSTGS